MDPIAESLVEATKSKDKVVHISEAAESEQQGVFSTPYPIGYDIFDEALKGGVRKGNLIIGTGISGHGKTTLFMNMSVNMCNTGHKCVWFSYEELISDVYAKFIEMGAKEDINIYTPNELITGEIEWIQEKIVEAKKEYGTEFVFIDHIDFITPKKIKSTDQLRMILKQAVVELKRIAIELDVVVFLIAHVKKVQGRSIEMQDIAESSGIYQLADAVFAVERKSRMEARGSKKLEILEDESYVRLLKNRITGKLPIMDFYLDNRKIVPWLESIDDDDFEKEFEKNDSQPDYNLGL